MKCILYKSSLERAKLIILLISGEMIIVIKNAPANVYNQSSEYYVDTDAVLNIGIYSGRSEKEQILGIYNKL